MEKRLISVLVFFSILSAAKAQDVGKISASFESNSHFYQEDEKIGAKLPDNKFASNNYLDFRYLYKNFTAGLRYEAYMPALIGFDKGYTGSDIANRFISFQNDDLLVTAGNFYEQFGSGLIFRAFEERQLGIDNSLDGVRMKYNFNNMLVLKAVMGRQRNAFLKYEKDERGQLRGFDADLSINSLFPSYELPSIKLAGSFVSKYERYEGESNVPTTVDSYASRMSIEGENANISIEYVQKDEDYNSEIFAPIAKGNALLVNGSVFLSGLSFNYTVRRIENMGFQSMRAVAAPQMMINYVPILVKQNNYSLSNVYVYKGNPEGEFGAQFDLFYKFKKNTALGGKYGTQIALNYAQYNDLKRKSATETEFFALSDDVFYKEFSVELTKKWSKKFKSIFVYHYQFLNEHSIEINPNILILNLQYKFTSKNALRMEFQHLSVDTDTKNWMASLAEFSFAPSWSVFAGDDYNYGHENKLHYYTCGFSFSKSSTKLIATYGRQREGLNCVGGVCRLMPAMKAFTLSLSTRF